MQHKGTKYIETQRLILRPFRMSDVPAVFHNWASDDEVTKYLTWPTHSDVAVTEMVIRDWVSRYDKQDYYQWAIVPKETPDAPIGSMAVVEAIDDNIKSAHIGYCIGKAWWNQGITSEALKAVMDYLFDEVGVNRIEARHDTENPNSGKVMKKCGMKYEGTLRQADRNNQGIRDVCYYGLLAGERGNL